MEVFKKDRNNYFPIHLLYWFFGIPTVKYGRVEAKLVGPLNCMYPLVVLTFLVGTRIERIIRDKSFLYDEGTPTSKTIYSILKSIEALAACCALVGETFLCKSLKLQFYQNLSTVDTILTSQEKYKTVPQTILRLYSGYVVYVMCFNIFDSSVWQTGIHSQFLLLKYILIDMMILQYWQELYLCRIRLQTTNEYFQGFGFTNMDSHGRRHFEFHKTQLSAMPRVVEKTKFDIDSCIIIYQKMIENMSILRRRISIHVLLVCLMSVMTTMTSANIMAHLDIFTKYNDPSKLISLFAWQLRYMLYLMFATNASEGLLGEGTKTLRTLGKINTSQNLDSATRFHIRKLIELVRRNQLRVTVWRLFPVDYTLMYTIIGLTTSYSIILIQMGQ